jgi:two-component system, cell cycle sensor histidine kinase and response regulator CckA
MTNDAEALLSAAASTLFYESQDAVYALDLDGRFIDVNQALADRLGYSRDELLAMGFAPTVEGGDSAHVAEHFSRAVAGETVRYLATGVRRDGSTFRADVVNTPLIVDGSVRAVLGVARDIDDIENARRTQESLEAVFESTLNEISDGLFFLDTDFVFTYVNPRAEQLSQRTREELLGTTMWDSFPLMVGSEFGIGYRRALAEQRKVTVRERYDPYDAVLEATAYPTQAGLAIHVRDVTEEEASRVALAENELRIASQAALLDSARDAIIVRGLDHRVRYWNLAAANLYGWSADEAVGSSIRELLYLTPEAFDAATAAVLENGEWQGDIEQLARDGRVILADCRWSLVRGADGEPEAIFAVNTDVTSRRRHEDSALRAQRMQSLGTLAGGIAHDLNNVLTPLLMSTQLLAAEETDPAKQATLAVIETSAKRGADMMRQVLEFARGVEGRRIHVDVQRLLGDTEAFCRESMPKSITVTVTADEDCWMAVGDPTQLLQVLLNLVGNARDAMPEGGDLRISAQNVAVIDAFSARLPTPGRYIHLRVEDTGGGMPPEVAQRVFEPFFTTKGVGEGTGLGLATSASIVQSHGGGMQVYSELDFGTRFDIHIPAAAPTTVKPNASVPTAIPEIPRGAGQLVLIVDDEPTIRLAARVALEQFGYRVAVAANGQEALDYLAQFPDEQPLIVSDMAMPVMDGPALLAELSRSHSQLPVLVTSGLSRWKPDPRLRQAYLAKPYSSEQLRREVARLYAADDTRQK